MGDMYITVVGPVTYLPSLRELDPTGAADLVVSRCSNLAELLSRPGHIRCDVILLSDGILPMDDAEGVATLRARWPEAVLLQSDARLADAAPNFPAAVNCSLTLEDLARSASAETKALLGVSVAGLVLREPGMGYRFLSDGPDDCVVAVEYLSRLVDAEALPLAGPEVYTVRDGVANIGHLSALAPRLKDLPVVPPIESVLLALVRLGGRTLGLLAAASEHPNAFDADMEERLLRDAGALAIPMQRFDVERALRESERKYRHLFETLSDAVLVADNESGVIVEANRMVCALTGHGYGRIVGMHFTEMVSRVDVPKVRALVRGQTEAGAASDDRIHILTVTGRRIPVQISTSPTTVAGRPMSLCLLRDMTEHDRLERRVRETESLRSLRSLAIGVAHNFNNLFTGMMGFAEFVRGQLVGAELPTSDLDKVTEMAQRGTELAQDLREWTELPRRQLEPVPAHTLLGDLEVEARAQIPASVTLQIECLCPDAVVLVCRESMVKALCNLCRNAWESMPEGGDLFVRAEKTAGEDGEDARELMVSIRDTGRGIEEKHISRVADPFFSTKGTFGAGLGLSIAQSLLVQCGGRLEMESRPGRGTIVRVFVPAEPDKDSPAMLSGDREDASQ